MLVVLVIVLVYVRACVSVDDVRFPVVLVLMVWAAFVF